MTAALAFRTVETPAFDWRATLDEIGPQLAQEGRRCDEANQFAAANFEILRAREFLALVVPAELGGHGLSRTETAAVLRAMAHYCPSTALALAMHTHSTAAAAWRWTHQKAPVDGLLKRIASERIQLLSSGGSDWLAGSGKAEKVEGGYRITARKNFASGAPAAQLFMTGAIEDDPKEGPTVLQFGVPMNAKGVSIEETWDTMGMRATGSHDVVFDGVFVPDAAVAARRKPGVWHPLLHLVSMIAFPIVYSVYTGVAEAARDIAVAEAVEAPRSGDRDRRRAGDRAGGDAHGLRRAGGVLRDRNARSRDHQHRLHPPFADRARCDQDRRACHGGRRRCRLLPQDVGLERLFRDIQGARYHPLTPVAQRRLAGRMALGLPIDG